MERKLHVVPSTPASDNDEVALVRRGAAGDKQAREAIALKLMRRVRNLAHHLEHDRAAAEDIAQAAMITILNSLSAFRGDSTLTSWADTITARVTYARLRKSKREAQVLALHGAGRNEEQNTSLEDGDLMLRQRLAQHFHKIHPDRRVVLVMKLISGCTLEDIATAVDAPVNTVKHRLRIGREELRQALLADPALAQIAKEVAS